MRGLLAIVCALFVALGAGAVEVVCIAPDTPHGASEEIFYRVEVTSNGTVTEATGLAVSLYVNGATLTLVLTVQAAGDTRRVPLDAWITSRLRAR